MIDPILLFFFLGLVAKLIKSNLRLPGPVYDLLIMILLLSIGLKGGVELGKQELSSMAPKIIVVFLIGLLLPLIAFPVLRMLGKFTREDAASIAAHYGSVSVGTFAVALSYANAHHIDYESYMPLFLVILEIPAILVGILLARGLSGSGTIAASIKEVLSSKGIVLLTGGLLIAWIAGEEKMHSISPFFFDLFKGVLALFLLEMGYVTANQIRSLKTYGLFLVAFGVLGPLLFSIIGIGAGCLLDLTVGGTAVLATLSASASYIAAPAAMRISVPKANPALSLSASLGVTFPFNIAIGVPLYYKWAQVAHQLIG